MERVELRNARFLDVERGVYHGPSTRLVIEGERIVAMPAQSGEAAASPHRVIDLRGLTVLPGLINTHAHVAMPIPGSFLTMGEARLAKKRGREQVHKSLSDCLRRGITHVRDCLCEDLTVSRRLKAGIETGELTGPRLHQCVLVCQPDGSFSAPRGLAERLVLPLLGMPVVEYDDNASGVLVFPMDASTAQVCDAVNRAIDERGADCIKLYDQREKKISYEPGARLMTQAQLDAAADQARRRGVKSTIHQCSVESFRRGVKAGVDVLAHLPLDGPLTAEDVAAFDRAGTMIEPTVSLAYFYSLARECDPAHPRFQKLDQLRTSDHRARLADYWLPELQPMVLRSLDLAVRGQRRSFGLFNISTVYTYFSRVVTQGGDNLATIAQVAGVDRIACGNDAGPDNSGPAGVQLELELLQLFLEPLLSPSDLVRVATINGARALGIEADFGSIETGKVADLAVVDGDPLQDRSVLGDPVSALFMAGRLVVDNCDLTQRSA